MIRPPPFTGIPPINFYFQALREWGRKGGLKGGKKSGAKLTAAIAAVSKLKDEHALVAGEVLACLEEARAEGTPACVAIQSAATTLDEFSAVSGGALDGRVGAEMHYAVLKDGEYVSRRSIPGALADARALLLASDTNIPADVFVLVQREPGWKFTHRRWTFRVLLGNEVIEDAVLKQQAVSNAAAGGARVLGALFA